MLVPLGIDQAYADLVSEGTRLAGALTDLAQRAAVYHHLYEASGRNHVFPLIAAHGALWARGYFRFGARLAAGLAWPGRTVAERRAKLVRVATFADALRDINRRVCIDTYASYHFVARYGDHPHAARCVRPELLAALGAIHAARRRGAELTTAEKRHAFEAHFLGEQATIVGPAIERAVAELDWPLVRFLALRPVIRFAYFPRQARLWFRAFDNRDERVRNGLRTFDLAAAAGWDVVEKSLREYRLLPDEFFIDSRRHFAHLRENLLAAA